MLKKFLASLATLALGAGLALTAASSASADAPITVPWVQAHNDPAWWNDYGPHDGAACYKHEADDAGVSSSDHGSSTGNTVTLAAFNQDWPGDHWELLVIKAGSTSETVVVHPAAGVAYSAPEGKDVSHWIVCKGTTPTPDPTPVTPAFSSANQDCVEDALLPGSISVVLKAGITYALTGPNPAPTVIDVSSGSSGALAPGTYHLTAFDSDANDLYTGSPLDENVVIGAYDGECGEVDDLPVTVEGESTDQICVPGTDDQPGSLTAGSIELTITGLVGISSISYSTDGGPSTEVDLGGSLVIEGLEPGDYDFVVVTEPGYEIDDNSFTVTVKEDNDPACKKVSICHWNEGQGGGYNFIEVSKKSIINVPNGHKFHENDIIPAFTYEGGSFPGQPEGQGELEGCADDPEETPVVVTEEHDDETCTVGDPDVLELGEVTLFVDNPAGVTKIEYRVKGSVDAWTEVDLNTLKVTGLLANTYEFKVTVAALYTIADDTFDVTIGKYTGEDCQLDTHGPITPQAFSTPATCSANGSYTLITPPAEPGLPDPSVLWYVNGSLVPTAAGTHTVTAPANVTVVAKAQPGYTFDDFTQERSFGPFSFTASTVCGDLTTLALTGQQNPAGFVGLAGFLGLLGLALVRGGVRLRRQSVMAEH